MSPSEANVKFTVRVTDPAAEVFLINEDYVLLKRGVGTQTFEAAPGAYKVKARRGEAIWEKPVLVRSGMRDVEVPHIEFAAPSPIEGTAWTHEHHVAALYSAASRPPDVTYSSGGSAIVVMARDWTEKQNTSQKTSPSGDPSRGLTLRTFDHELVADIEEKSVKDLGWEPVATCHISLPPGAYKLVLEMPGQPRVEQTLVASPGWTTHLHLLLSHEGEESMRRVDLGTSAISLRKAPPWNVEDLQLEEIARQALLDERSALSDFFKTVVATTELPMLALYGAHLLIREAQRAHYAHKDDEKVAEIDNRPLVAAAVDHLRALLGDHPDVEAIAIGAGKARPDYHFVYPPMLRASWLLLLRESSQQQELIPPGSYALGIAERMWGDGAWLTWTEEGTQESDRSAVWTAQAADLIKQWDVPEPSPALESLEISSIQTGEAAAPSWLDSVKSYCNDTYKSVKSKLARPANMPFPDLEKAAQKSVERAQISVARAREILSDPERRKTLVRQIGVPINSINAWLDKLDGK